MVTQTLVIQWQGFAIVKTTLKVTTVRNAKMASMETQLKEMKMIASFAPVCLAPAAFRLLKELFAQTVLKVTQGICVTFVKMVTMVTF